MNAVRNIVSITDGRPVTTSLSIAEGVGSAHKSVIQLIRQNSSDLSEFGPLAFEMRVVNRHQGGGSATEYAILNEQQSTLLITYMRNNDVVRAFKKHLVASFYQARERVRVPHNFSDSLRLLADEHDRRQALDQENRELSRQLTAQADNVAFHDAVTGGEGLYSVKEAAALLGTGQNRLMTTLRDMNWVDDSNCPYQRKLDAGLMDRKLSQYQHPERGAQNSITPMITGKGLAKLQTMYSKGGSGDERGVH